MVIQVPLQVRFENISELSLKYYPNQWGYHFYQEAHCGLFYSFFIIMLFSFYFLFFNFFFTDLYFFISLYFFQTIQQIVCFFCFFLLIYIFFISFFWLSFLFLFNNIITKIITNMINKKTLFMSLQKDLQKRQTLVTGCLLGSYYYYISLA